MNKKFGLILTAMLVLALGLSGCTSPTPAPPPPPSPTDAPPATAVIAPEPAKPQGPGTPVLEPAGPEVTVEAGQKLAVKANAEGATTYEWTLQGEGELSGTTGPAVLYTAPKESTMAILTVTAANDQGTSPAAFITLNVPGIAAVKLDAVGIPAGWMSGGSNPATYVEMKSAEASECQPGTTCQRVTYRIGGGWNGVIWWPLACGDTGSEAAWSNAKASTCSVNVLSSGGLSVINSLTFWARGSQGQEVIEFKVGAVDILPSPGRSTGKITLTKDWKQYTLDMKGVDLTQAVSLFTWVAADSDNPNGAIFYLGDIQFEGVK